MGQQCTKAPRAAATSWDDWIHLDRLQERFQHQSQSPRRRVLFYALSFGYLLASSIWGLLNYLGGYQQTAVFSALVAMALFLNLLSYRQHRCVNIAGNVFGGVVFVAVSIPIYLDHPRGVSWVYLLAILPLFLVALTGLKTGAYWCLLCVLNLSIAPFVPEPSLTEAPVDLSPELLQTISAIFVLAMAILLATTYELTKRDNLIQLEENGSKLKAAIKEVQAVTTAKNRFLTNMSQEIGMPLNGVLESIEGLDKFELDEDSLEFKNLAHDSANALVKLLSNLIILSKAEAGKLELAEAPFSLRSLADSIVADHHENAQTAQVSLKAVFLEGIPDWVVGDQSCLYRLLHNLVCNGIKFTPSGGTVVLRFVGETIDNYLNLTILVEDTGIGIAQEKLETIFDVFTQADVSSARAHEGTGLGLALCSQLSQLQGGTLEVCSEIEQGSTFELKLSLPLAASLITEPAPTLRQLEQR